MARRTKEELRRHLFPELYFSTGSLVERTLKGTKSMQATVYAQCLMLEGLTAKEAARKAHKKYPDVPEKVILGRLRRQR
jgi:hypothetical protein